MSFVYIDILVTKVTGRGGASVASELCCQYSRHVRVRDFFKNKELKADKVICTSYVYVNIQTTTENFKN